MPDATLEELKLLRIVGVKITENLRKELVAQGHHLTGALEESIHGTAITNGTESTLIGTIAFYGKILSAGVSADRIPFNPGSGAKHSKYIDGLISYFKLRGLSEKEATRAAFATAKKHKKEGMPTSGSYQYSSTGQRKDFIGIVDTAISPEVEQLLSDGLDQIVDNKFHETKSETI